MTDGTIQSLLKLGFLARRESRLLEAKEHYATALKSARESGDLALQIQALTGVGRIERDLGEIDASLGHYREAVAVCRRVGDPLLLAHAIRQVGDILRTSGDLEAGNLDSALACYEEALAIYRNSTETNLLDLANTLRGFALLDDAQGRKDAAISKWREAGELYDQVWRLPDSPYSEADLAPGVEESKRQVALLSASC